MQTEPIHIRARATAKSLQSPSLCRIPQLTLHLTCDPLPHDHSVDHVVKGGSKISESMMRLDGVDPFFVGREGWCCCFEG